MQSLCAQLTLGLSTGHANAGKGVVHRDLKPGASPSLPRNQPANCASGSLAPGPASPSRHHLSPPPPQRIFS